MFHCCTRRLINWGKIEGGLFAEGNELGLHKFQGFWCGVLGPNEAAHGEREQYEGPGVQGWGQGTIREGRLTGEWQSPGRRLSGVLLPGAASPGGNYRASLSKSWIYTVNPILQITYRQYLAYIDQTYVTFYQASEIHPWSPANNFIGKW